MGNEPPHKDTEGQKWVDARGKEERQSEKRLKVEEPALTGIVGIEVKKENEEQGRAKNTTGNRRRKRTKARAAQRQSCQRNAKQKPKRR
jgi:hypothetical protein